METNRSKFSQRHPLIFGFMLILAAVVTFMVAMAVFNYLFFDGPRLRTQPKIGVVNIQGLITDSRELVEWIHRLEEDDAVQGVLLRINSPGGMVAPSQEVYQAVHYLAQQKIVVASLGAVAASGGYYTASPSHRIVANPGTLTASIGVKATLTNVEELMRKLGIDTQAIYSGEYKDAGSMARPMTEEERAYFQSLVDDMHDQFVEDVARGRDMDEDRVRALADGRAMTGRQALEAGLVDELGGLREAMQILQELAEVDKRRFRIVEGPEERVSLLRWILSEFSLGDKFYGPKWVFTYE